MKKFILLLALMSPVAHAQTEPLLLLKGEINCLARTPSGGAVKNIRVVLSEGSLGNVYLDGVMSSVVQLNYSTARNFMIPTSNPFYDPVSIHIGRPYHEVMVRPGGKIGNVVLKTLAFATTLRSDSLPILIKYGFRGTNFTGISSVGNVGGGKFLYGAYVCAFDLQPSH